MDQGVDWHLLHVEEHGFDQGQAAAAARASRLCCVGWTQGPGMKEEHS
jgi:hypothetical protein